MQVIYAYEQSRAAEGMKESTKSLSKWKAIMKSSRGGGDDGYNRGGSLVIKPITRGEEDGGGPVRSRIIAVADSSSGSKMTSYRGGIFLKPP